MTQTMDIPERTLFASDEAQALTRDSFVFDALTLFYILDDPYVERCLEGGVNATNFTVVAEGDFDDMIRKIEIARDKIDRHPLLRLVLSADDARAAQAEGKLGILLATQGASMIGKELWRVSLFYRLGLRTIGLAYTPGNLFADGCGELRDAGLSFLGQEFVDAVNDLPMMLDLSHTGHRARAEATARALRPVCTHSNSYSVNPNDRNTRDETAKAIVDKGGVVGLCGLPATVKPADPTLHDMMNHAAHYLDLLGPEGVGIGLDFTEAYQEAGTIMDVSRRWRTLRPDIFGTVEDFNAQSYPRGLESIRLLPNFTQVMLDRGLPRETATRILGANWLACLERMVG